MDIAFVADKGGVGKTTVSYHVATRLRQLGHDVGLLDLDRRGTASWWVDLAEEAYFPAYALAAVNELPEHDFRVWDTPAHINDQMQQALADLCEAIVVVSTTDAASFLAAAQIGQSLLAKGGHVAVMINGVHPAARDTILSSLDGSGLHLLQTAVRRYSCYEKAQWDGRAVIDGPYPSADNAWSDISELTREILAFGEIVHA